MSKERKKSKFTILAITYVVKTDTHKHLQSKLVRRRMNYRHSRFFIKRFQNSDISLSEQKCRIHV